MGSSMNVKLSPRNLGLTVYLSFIILCWAIECGGESGTCLADYKEGGAPAVFRSPHCPLRSLQDGAYSPESGHCQTAVMKGRRKYMEDRIFCALDLRIPFPGKAGPKDVVVGVAAVFDGHNGAEASEMASKLLFNYFALHTNLLLDATYSVVPKEMTGRLPDGGKCDLILNATNWDRAMHQDMLNFERFRFTSPLNFDDSFHLDILKEALVRAIRDIDAIFSQEAYRRNLDSGSTAAIALIADGQLLVANIGDSKALLCSEKFETPEEARASLLKLYREQRRNGNILPSTLRDLKLKSTNGRVRYHVKELTEDHHPDREDEKMRVEAAGGHVVEWAGVPRVNGQLAVSRAIGDVSFKSYGVISAPEVIDWRPLVANDSFLVVASDGIFEKQSLQDVCDLLWEAKDPASSGKRLPPHCSSSLADCLVNAAFEKGSMDNMAAVVVPLC
ncbi:PREDICTED: probable protein phosphatase 2C 51 [Tarenaya hassleriana]|uniref:probable protein phosphatase 2C 51 n=1 Tax=Tarenaya hassleriana TaxID=28532 RepID=UPI00053C1BD9|nr:PREDICTED: probable protein phosphatase 2C 51 [Tarenaya hassleriana]